MFCHVKSAAKHIQKSDEMDKYRHVYGILTMCALVAAPQAEVVAYA